MSAAHDGLIAWFRRFEGVHTRAWHHVDGALTFDELHAGVSRLCARILTFQEGDRSPVLIHAHKDRRFAIAYWAALLLGRPIVPVEPDTPAARLREIVQQCRAGLMLRAGTAPANPPDVPCPALQVELAGASLEKRSFPKVSAGDRDACYILFSSGTSGAAKGIQIGYDNLQDFVCWLSVLKATYGAPQGVSGNVRHCFDVSLFELWMSWTSLATLCVLDHRHFADPGAHVRQLGTCRAGWWVSTPSMIRFFLKLSDFNARTLPDLDLFLFCGEVLPKDIVAGIWDRFPSARILNTYGPTECTVAVTSVEIRPGHLACAEPLPIGRARAGTELTLGDGADTTGEIMISGKSVGLGYLGLPDRQRRAFPSERTYLTGDQGRIDPDGTWHFQGRRDREVKIQGVRIDLNTIETTIRAEAGVEDVVVDLFQIRGEARGLSAYVVGMDSREDLAELARALADRLPPYALPRRWYGGLPRQLNQNGKLDRSQLAALADGGAIVHVQAPAELTV